MQKGKPFLFIAIALLTFWYAFALATPVSADTKIFEQGGWVVSGAKDTAPNARKIRVTVNGVLKGKFSELKIARMIGVGNYPQVFSVKGSGALRAALPNGTFGGTFYATGYWDCDPNVGLVQDLYFTKLDLSLDAGNVLRIRGKATNLNSLRAPNFTLRISPLANNQLTVGVNYKLVATRNFCVDATRQELHEGFRIARIASNYISPSVHDSDRARYVNASQQIVCTDLQNQDGFILNNPTTLGQPTITLAHTTNLPEKDPTLAIEFIQPPLSQITPQGWVSQSAIEDDDNVDFWGNWDGARASYLQGEVVRRFEYKLKVSAPGVVTCN